MAMAAALAALPDLSLPRIPHISLLLDRHSSHTCRLQQHTSPSRKNQKVFEDCIGFHQLLNPQTDPFRRFPEDGNCHEKISRQLAAIVQSPASKKKQESSERDEFYANMGSAIRTLREEMPSVFYKDLNYDIYRQDITFQDPRNTISGIDNYKLIFWALRFHGRIFFRAIWVDGVRIWQPSDRVIIVRWTVRGIPRVPWEAQGLFDGTSQYTLDKDGKIYEHKVDNVALNYPPMFRTRSVFDLLSTAGSAMPTPTCFDRVVLASRKVFPNLKTSTWERFYWALTLTLSMQNNKRWSNWYVVL